MSKDSVASGAVLTRTADVDVHIPLFIYNKAPFVPVVELLTCFHPHQAFTLWGIFSFLSSKSKAGTSSDAKSATKEGCMELRLPLEESKLRSKFPAVDLAAYNRVITAVADRRPRAAACKYIWLVSLQHAFIALQAVVELLETGQTSNAAATARIGQVIAVMKRHASLHAFDAPKQNMEFLKHTSEQSPELLADTKRRIACLYNPASHPEQIINLILYNLQIFEGSWLKLWENVGGKFVFHPYSIVSGQMETNQAETSEDEQVSKDAEDHDCELLGLEVGSTAKAEAAKMDMSRNTTIPETNSTAVGTLKPPLGAIAVAKSGAGGAASGAASESRQTHKRSFSTISTTNAASDNLSSDFGATCNRMMQMGWQLAEFATAAAKAWSQYAEVKAALDSHHGRELTLQSTITSMKAEHEMYRGTVTSQLAEKDRQLTSLQESCRETKMQYEEQLQVAVADLARVNDRFRILEAQHEKFRRQEAHVNAALKSLMDAKSFSGDVDPRTNKASSSEDARDHLDTDFEGDDVVDDQAEESRSKRSSRHRS